MKLHTKTKNNAEIFSQFEWLISNRSEIADIPTEQMHANHDKH